MKRPVVRILSLLVLIAGLRGLPLPVAATQALVGRAGTLPAQETRDAGNALRQDASATNRSADSAPASSSPNAQTAQQWMAEGRQAQKAGKQLDAIRDFLNAQRLAPSSPDPLYSLGMSFFTIGFYNSDPEYYDRASRHFKAALELDPQYDRAVFMLSVLAVLNLRLQDAESLIQKAVALKPQNPYYHLHYGILLERLGRNGDAEAQMRLAEKLDPTYAQSYLTLGQFEVRMRKYQEARGQLERAVHLNPELASAHYALVDVYRLLGMNAESKSAYETFQRLKAAQPQADPVMGAMQGSPGSNSK